MAQQEELRAAPEAGLRVFYRPGTQSCGWLVWDVAGREGFKVAEE